MQVTQENEGSKHGHRDRSRRRRTRRAHAGGGLASEARAWLKLIDGVLRTVESTAWAARSVANDVAGAWGATVGDVAAFEGEVAGPSRGVVRLTRTGFALGQIAMSYRLYSLRAAFMPERKAERLLARLHEQNAARFYEACIEHGGAFLKVGQILSARPDLLPEPWVSDLSKLQDAAPALPFATVKAAIEDSLGAPLADLFAHFEEAPIGAASIGQVHRAVLRGGREVAVKLRRPGIEALVRADLRMLELFMDGMRSSLPELDYDTIISEVSGAVLAELDYGEEAHMTATVARAFAGDASVVIPTPVEQASNGQVLTTSFIRGRKVTTVLDELQARAQDGDAGARAEISDILGRLLAAYLKQILVFGTFQADPHPGNLLVADDGRVCILDFGCSKALLPARRASYIALMRAFIAGDRAAMDRLFGELGFGTQSGEHDTLHAFAGALLTEFQSAMATGRFEWPDKNELLSRASSVARACEIDPVTRIPPDFVLIARVLGTLGGLFSHYEPDISVAAHVLPILGDVLARDPQTEGDLT